MDHAFLEVPDSIGDNPKSVLAHIVQKHLGRCTKSDLEYRIVETAKGEFIGQVTVAHLGLHNIQGPPQQKKKLAEQKAAEVAHRKIIQVITGKKPPKTPPPKAAPPKTPPPKAAPKATNVKVSNVMQTFINQKAIGHVTPNPHLQTPAWNPGKRKLGQVTDPFVNQAPVMKKSKAGPQPLVATAKPSMSPAASQMHDALAKSPGSHWLIQQPGKAGKAPLPGKVQSVPKVKSVPKAKAKVLPSLGRPMDPFVTGNLMAMRGGKLVQVGMASNQEAKQPGRGPIGGPKPPPGPPPKALLRLSSMATGTKRKKGPKSSVDSDTSWTHLGHILDISDGIVPEGKKRKLSPNASVDADTSWTKRTAEEKAEVRKTYEEWRNARASIGLDPDLVNMTSFDSWYASVCLVCLSEVQLINFPGHAQGQKHSKAYKEIGGLQLHDGIQRPDAQLSVPLQEATKESFASLCGFEGSRVLILGEQDYSFSLKVAQVQNENGMVSIVATSYLAAHDPEEVEFHAKDDGERTRYSRRSLPSMEGALLRNIADLEELGGLPLHSVDATNFEETLLPQIGDSDVGQFDVIVFPFPRASLKRGCDPRNSQLLRGFFRSVADTGLLAPNGAVELLMLQNQYAEWDTACMGLEHGFQLYSRVALPDGFYQSREMSGKPWKPQGGEMYIFSSGEIDENNIFSHVKEEEIPWETEDQPVEESPSQLKPAAKKPSAKSRPKQGKFYSSWAYEAEAPQPAKPGKTKLESAKPERAVQQAPPKDSPKKEWQSAAFKEGAKSASWWALRTCSISESLGDDTEVKEEEEEEGEDDDGGLNLASLAEDGDEFEGEDLNLASF